jgi:hypothetical protein
MNSNMKITLIVVIIARFLQIFVDLNHDYADEYWQGTEVAYHLAHRYGYSSW